MDAERELRRRLELRLAELGRRLSMDSTDSGTPCGTVTFAGPPPGAHAGAVSYGPMLTADGSSDNTSPSTVVHRPMAHATEAT